LPFLATRKLITLSSKTSTTKLKALTFKRIERGKKGGGSPSLAIREFRTLSLKNSKKV
jgi:hypothetical protein